MGFTQTFSSFAPLEGMHTFPPLLGASKDQQSALRLLDLAGLPALAISSSGHIERANFAAQVLLAIDDPEGTQLALQHFVNPLSEESLAAQISALLRGTRKSATAVTELVTTTKRKVPVEVLLIAFGNGSAIDWLLIVGEARKAPSIHHQTEREKYVL